MNWLCRVTEFIKGNKNINIIYELNLDPLTCSGFKTFQFSTVARDYQNLISVFLWRDELSGIQGRVISWKSTDIVSYMYVPSIFRAEE
jgi:hypothetical protein